MRRMTKEIKEEIARITKYCYYGNYSSAEERLKNYLKNRLERMGLYGKGVYYALKGVVEALKEQNEYSAIYRIVNASTAREAREIRELLSIEEMAKLDDFDLGYFEAWRIVAETVESLKSSAVKQGVNQNPKN